MNIEALLKPSAAKALPEGSLERAVAFTSLRRLWHIIFDPAPALLTATGQNSSDLMDQFLEWSADEKLTMNWTLHAHLLQWLINRHPHLMSAKIERELLVAAVSRWAVSDLSPTIAIAIHRAESGAAVAAWKPETALREHRISAVKITFHPEKVGISWCRLTNEQESKLMWENIPR